jgi:hypothetical protein
MTDEMPDPRDIDWSKYNRFNCPIISDPYFPTDISEYPFVICSDDESFNSNKPNTWNDHSCGKRNILFTEPIIKNR